MIQLKLDQKMKVRVNLEVTGIEGTSYVIYNEFFLIVEVNAVEDNSTSDVMDCDVGEVGERGQYEHPERLALEI